VSGDGDHGIFILPQILNEAMVSSHIQDILRHGDFFPKEKTLKYEF